MAQHPVANEVFVAARSARGWHTQSEFAEAYDVKAQQMNEQARISVRQIRRWESGATTWPNRDARRVLTALFDLPLEDLGFIRPPRPSGRSATAPTEPMELEEDVRRRTFLGGALASAVPLFDLDALEHLTAAARDARRYSDHELLDHLRGALDDSARSDGRIGPHQALPATLGILATISSTAREARPEIRRSLLVLGARGAELAAWLHKDGGAPDRDTAYWHQQSKEWATLTGDGPMHAYVLLRQAQATDRRDPALMLDLARAATTGPWTLPPRPRAEALQQEARALAMTGATLAEIDRVLDRAQAALGQAAPITEPPTCTGPLGDSYTTERLMVQTAICYREAGQPERAAHLFQHHLATGTFAPRDRAFFTAHLAGALAAAGEPDEAAAAALLALGLASAARFGQALSELHRTAAQLQPHRNRAAVQELHQRLATVAA
ncbi:XRE family transcriptional regulator [Kitasatospora sp. GP82]|uniref:helix-turn-helix domain-containing protein n=1 Tax=Kitasatospora sp. GP82 TaxID=3035089 RepID=UPI00247439BA|nr:XRE family transcriptional regulator [Kitasatospora sp. GP82]MDH6128835.1 tetratricopeptide (TPR) repeat protein [Kitasatospora sp. GP82]